MTTTSRSHGSGTDGSVPTPGSAPFSAATPHGKNAVVPSTDGGTSDPRVTLLANKLSNAVSRWMSPSKARADARSSHADMGVVREPFGVISRNVSCFLA